MHPSPIVLNMHYVIYKRYYRAVHVLVTFCAASRGYLIMTMVDFSVDPLWLWMASSSADVNSFAIVMSAEMSEC